MQASSISKQLEEAYYLCAAKNLQRNARGLNSFKSLYIKSLIKNDEKLTIKALRGLIKCSKLLGLSTKEYQIELDALQGKKSSVTSKKSKKRGNALKKVVLRKGYIEFYFDFPLKKELIHQSNLAYKRKRLYKEIYDIGGRLEAKRHIYRLRTIKRMKIAQYTPKKLRIVFEHSRPFGTSYKLVGKKLIVYLHKKPIKKSVKITKEEIFSPDSFVEQNSQRVIVIDPGHGGKDSGAIGYKKKREKDIVLQIAKKVYKKLKAQGYKVYMTRRGDYFIQLHDRTKFANRVNANLFISIHANAAPKKSKYLSLKGVETFFLSPARSKRAKRIAALENKVAMEHLSYYSKNVFLNFINREKTIQSNKLAIDIHRSVLYEIRRRYKVEDGGVRPGPFWVLVGAQMPAILLEVGYITNPTEAKRLSSPYYQELIARGIVSGVTNYFRHNE